MIRKCAQRKFGAFFVTSFLGSAPDLGMIGVSCSWRECGTTKALGVCVPIIKLCCVAGCDDLAVDGGPHCAEHAARVVAKAKAARAKAKQSAAARKGAALYGTAFWKVESKKFLKLNPLCVDCEELGVVEEAEEVDHIIPHRGDRKLFGDKSNWQGLCKSCHSRKTAREVFSGGVSRKS